MPELTEKQFPSDGPPSLPDLAHDEGVEIDEGPAVRIVLDVDNGHAAERYHFRFDGSSTGRSEVRLTDAFREVADERATGTDARETVTRALDLVDFGQLAFRARTRPRIPPGSLVARLTIARGAEQVKHIFMADEEQAKTAGVEPDPRLSELLESLYEAGAKQLGRDDIRP